MNSFIGGEFVLLIIWMQRFKLIAGFKKKKKREIGLVKSAAVYNVISLISYTFYKINEV